MKNNDNQFVIYPHPANSEPQPDLDPKDKLIYVAIRRYMNKQTMEAYPSYAIITKDTGAAAKTIKKCVGRLVEEKYLEVRKEGRKLIYKFNNKKQFEPYSYAFLDKPELTFTEKSYIIASQQYMFKDEEEGTISYSNKELSSLIRMSEAQISKCNHSLERKGFLEGSSELVKRFQLRELDQLFIYKFKEHEDRINQNTDDIIKLKEQIKSQKKLIEELLKEKEKTQTEFIME